MFVTRVILSDRSEKFELSQTSGKADCHWVALIKRATNTAAKRNEAVTAQMYDVMANDAAAALHAVKSGDKHLVKSVTIGPPTRLREKVRFKGPGLIDTSALERAEKIIAQQTDTFLEDVLRDLGRVIELVKLLMPGAEDAQKRLGRIYRIAYRIKGQGGTFGYPLLTAIADRLCIFIDTTDPVDRRAIESIKVHIDMMSLAISQKLSDDGIETGGYLVSHLDRLHDNLKERQQEAC